MTLIWIRISDNVESLSTCLSRDAMAILNWAVNNHLSLNISKTHLLLLSRPRRQHELSKDEVQMGDVILERCDKVKCQGVWLDCKLKWNEHIDYVKNKCYRALAQLRRLRYSIPPEMKKLFFNVFVLPHLDYCAVI